VSDLHVLAQLRALIAPIHKDGYKFVAIAAAVTAVAFLLSNLLGLVALIATLALVFFFRDPRRVVPTQEGIIVAPADGRIISIGIADPPPELCLGSVPLTRISIFLSVFDVHVIRAPANGRVVTSFYRPGRHINAGAPEAPSENECHGFGFETKNVRYIGAVLVAGKVARRIVTGIKEGGNVLAGERIGIIRFGSRTDIYLPGEASVLAAEGQRTIAGETVIAEFDRTAAQRQFRPM
jgi:phosphatidylserine decarboxylase